MFLVLCRATHVIIGKVKLSNLWRAQDTVVPDITVGSTPWGERANGGKKPQQHVLFQYFQNIPIFST